MAAYPMLRIGVLALLAVLSPLSAGAVCDPQQGETQCIVPSTDFDCSTAKLVPESECEALVNFHKATGGSSWKNCYLWRSSTAVCDWGGVTCGFAAGGWHVIELNLHDNNLSGSLPGKELAKLTHLGFLKLSQNCLDGSIPGELGQLDRLHTLFLDSNQLTGSIPSSLAAMDNLTDLSASSNALTGTIPEALMGFCSGCPVDGKYGLLRLVGNDLEGGLPADIGRTNISTLDFRNNSRLTGPIPDNYARLNQVGFFGYLGTNVCTPAVPDIQTWLNNIQSVLGSRLVCAEEYSISGRVLHVVTGEPFLDSIKVTTAGGASSDQTDAQGYYEITGLPAGTYTVTSGDDGLEFTPASREVAVPPDADNVNFAGRLPGSIVSGRVTDEEGNPIFFVILDLFPPFPGGNAATDEAGRYVIDGVDPGTYEIEPVSESYFFEPPSRSFTVPPDAGGMDFVGTPLDFGPTVSALGPGWDLNGTVLDPNLSSLLEKGDSLRYACSPTGDSAVAPCTLPQARVAFETTGANRRCELISVTPLPPDQDASAGYQASLELVELPLPSVCDPPSGFASATLQSTTVTTLRLAAGEEGFLYRMVPPGLGLGVNSDRAAVVASGHSMFSVRHQSVAGETTVATYFGSLEVTPTNPSLAPFPLVPGQRVTVTSDAVILTADCAGDCGGDGEVTVDELITAVNIALGATSIGWCPSFDSDGGGEITVNELVTGVNNAVSGCP